MTYIATVPVEEAEGMLRNLYEQDRTSFGYIPNYTMAMSLRPEVITAWRNLSRAIRANLSLRRYELVTIAASRALRCTY